MVTARDGDTVGGDTVGGDTVGGDTNSPGDGDTLMVTPGDTH